LRQDGMFDIAVGRKGSPLDNPNNFKQFTEEGYFAGQRISVNGKDLVYIGKSGDQAFVRVAGDPRLIKINLSDIRRPKDVSFIYTDPEVKPEIGGGKLPKEGFVVANIGSNGKVYYGEPGEIHIMLDQKFPISERGQWQRVGFAGPDGFVLSREAALANVERIAKLEGIKFRTSMEGELDALDLREQIQGELLSRALRKSEQTAEKQLEGVITPEEIEVFKALREEVHPLEPSTEAKTFDQIRQEASTNGLELTRTASNTFIIRDRATGQELFKGATKEDAERFINDSGQDGTVVFDGNVPIDTDIPGNVMPPPPPGLRVNEPFDFPPNTKMGTIIDFVQSTRPGAIVTPFGHFASALDNILGTKVFSEVFIKTQETRGRSVSRALPWLRKLKEIEKIATDAKLSPADLEVAFQYVETKNLREMLGDPKKGEGLLKGRRVNENEVSSKDLLIELDVDLQRLYKYIRARNQEFYAEARELRVDVKNLDPIIKKSIEDGLIDSRDMTPNEMAGVEIFDFIRTKDLNDLSLYVVSRLVEAERAGSLSRADFAAKNNMTAAQIKFALEIEKIQADVAALPDVPIDDIQLIRGFMAHYAEQQTATLRGSILGQEGTSREMAFVHAMIRSGETDPYNMNPIAVTARYIRNAFNSIEFNDAWNNANRYVDNELVGKFGKDGATASLIVRSYLTDVRGVPAASTKYTRMLTEAFFKKLGWKMDPNILRTLVDMQLAFTNAAFMGARPGLAGRDIVTTTSFHYSRFGGVKGKRTMRALELAVLAAKSGEMKQLRDSGELPTIGIIEYETAAQLEASAVGKIMGGLPAMTKKIAEIGLTLSMQRNAYEFSYVGILLEAKETALRGINDIVDAGLTREAKAKAYKEIGLDTYNLETKKTFDQFINSGEYERAASFLGQQTAREVLGVYGRGNHPWGWGTNSGRLITHYGTWPSNAMAFMLAGMSRGSKKQRLAFATRFAMTQAGLALASDAVGLNIHSWMILPGLFFVGGPAVQTADLIIESLTGYGRDKDRARRRLKRLLPAWDDPRSMFIPFSYVLGDLIFAVENSDNPIEFFGRSFAIPLKKGRSWLDDF
ncbi:hypothetical protein LCGC14_1507950, partial [marine sediment metagenome]